TLTIESYVRSSFADCLMNFHVGIYQSTDVPNHNPLRTHAHRFEHIELFERAFAEVRMGEDRKGCCKVRFAHGTEDLAFIRSHYVPSSDLAEHPDRFGIRLPD